MKAQKIDGGCARGLLAPQLVRDARTPGSPRRPLTLTHACVPCLAAVAKEVLTGILDLLGPQDRLGIVLFSDSACAPLPLTPLNCTDIPAVKAAVRAGRGGVGWGGVDCSVV